LYFIIKNLIGEGVMNTNNAKTSPLKAAFSIVLTLLLICALAPALSFATGDELAKKDAKATDAIETVSDAKEADTAKLTDDADAKTEQAADDASPKDTTADNPTDKPADEPTAVLDNKSAVEQDQAPVIEPAQTVPGKAKGKAAKPQAAPITDQASLQNAIASASNGDTLEVESNINLASAIAISGKTLTIKSKSGTHTLKTASTRHFILTGGELTLANLTLDGGSNGTNISGGIMADGAKVSLQNVKVQNCAYTSGGGISVNNSSTLSLNGNTEVTNNTAIASDSGGIYAKNSAVTLNDNSKVTNNSAGSNYGGICSEDSTLTLNDNSQVSNNVVHGYWGGGIGVVGNSTFAANGSSAIINNKAVAGGAGIEIGNGSVATLDDNVVVSGNVVDRGGNSWGGNGGGINVGYGSTLNIKGSAKVANNKATNNGGGINAGYSSVVTLSGNAKISDNNDTIDGGGICIDDNGLLSTSGAVKFSNNKAGTLYLSAKLPGNASSAKLTGVSSITPTFQFPLTYPQGAMNNNSILAFNNYDISETIGYVCFDVSFYDDDTTTLLKRIAVVETGDAIPPADPTRNGFSFSGWDRSFANVTSEFDVYATYTRELYTVTYAPGDHGRFSAQTIGNLHYGDSRPDIPVYTLGQAGWKFAGWSPALAATITSSVVYTAQWDQITYTLTYHGNGSTAGKVPASAKLAHGSSYTVADAGSMARDGYTFSGWSTDPDGSVTHVVGSSKAITADTHLYAIWAPVAVTPPDPDPDPDPQPQPQPQPQTYTVSYAAGGANVEGLPQGATLVAGANYTVSGSVPSREGFEFSGWSSSMGGTAEAGASFVMPEADVVLTATWETEEVIVPPATPEQPFNSEQVDGVVNHTNPSFSPDEQVKLAAQSGNPLMDIVAGNVPLGSLNANGAWSLANLLMALIAVFGAIATAISALIGYVRNAKCTLVFKVAAVLLGVATGAVFAVVENINQPYCWVNQWTLLVGTLFTISVVGFIIQALAGNPVKADTNTASPSHQRALQS
jgi:uncharacterized repeat protein (TIGR02543 family)